MTNQTTDNSTNNMLGRKTTDVNKAFYRVVEKENSPISINNSNLFNIHKNDYDKPSLFLGQGKGLLDTVHQHYPDILDLYKRLLSLNWSPYEFDFKPCNAEFKSCSKSIYEMMLLTLRWQWEMDTIVHRSISTSAIPLVSSSELEMLWNTIAYNETTHAAAYSEIVRNSFDDPAEVLIETLSIPESLKRLETVTKILDKAYNLSNAYAIGLIPNSDDLYDNVFMYVVSLLAIERIQFMASFAITFSIGETGLFMPIAKSVQKICQDEFEIHVEADKAILRHEIKTQRGIGAYNRNKGLIKKLFDEVLEAEFTWTKFLFSEGRELVGMTPSLLNEWVLWCAKDAYQFLGIDCDYKFPDSNPLPFMDNWVKNNHQPAPQEEKSVAYMLGMMVSDSDNKEFDIEDL